MIGNQVIGTVIIGNHVIGKHTTMQKIILTLHIMLFLCKILSPFYLSWETQIRYGPYIYYLSTATIIGWVVFGRCIISDLENSHKLGSIPTFFCAVLGLNINGYYRHIQNFVTYSIFLIKLYYAPTIGHMFFSCFVLLLYKAKQWYQNFNIKEV